jgi:hypothetical protein
VLHHVGHDEVDAGKAEAGSTPAARVAATAIKNTRVIGWSSIFKNLARAAYEGKSPAAGSYEPSFGGG